MIHPRSRTSTEKSWLGLRIQEQPTAVSLSTQRILTESVTASAPEPTPNGLWGVNVDVALPCATQNELNGAEAQMLVDNNVIAVAEGANMPCTPEAGGVFQKNGVLFAPGKASNAGGVATSGLEMSQNSLRLSWTSQEVDEKLDAIMVGITMQPTKLQRNTVVMVTTSLVLTLQASQDC